MKRPLHSYRHVLLLSMLCLAITVCANAQLSYTLSFPTSTYSANSSPTTLVNSSVDDGISSTTNIGFTFTYNCQDYTTFRASSNGWFCFGNGTSSSLPTNDLSTTGNGPLVAPLWDDLATSSSGNVNYKLSGSSPNRVLTIEWKAMRWSKATTNAVISFQARLTEGTNEIEFRYYRETYAVSSGSASIGINSGTSSTDYYSLNSTGATPTANYGSQTSNLSAKPATNEAYKWTPASTIGNAIATQAITSSISRCNTQNQQIIGLEIPTNGCGSNTLNLSQLVIRMNGSDNPTTDVSNIHVYYTGTSSTFVPINEFNSSAIASSASNITITGSQNLSSGTNYFWVTYDINPNATVGNGVDAEFMSLTASGTAYTPTITAPTGKRLIGNCIAAPGGINNASFWIKANAGTSTTVNGAIMDTWNDQSGNNRNATSSISHRPFYYDNSTNNINFNPVVGFDRSYEHAMDINSTGVLSANNNAYEVYAVLRPSNKNLSVPGKFFSSGGTANNSFNSFDVRSSYSFNDSWNFNDLIIANTWTPDYPVISTFDYNTIKREMFISGSSAGTLTISNRVSLDNYYAIGYQRSTFMEFYDGSIAELIAYTNTQSPLTRQKIESYLAIKYGQTLSHNYYSSSNTAVWNTSLNSSYNKNIIGMARDDNSGLSQKQSKSTATTSDILTMYLGTTKQTNQANNTTAFTSGDNSFFMVGNNGTSILFPGAVSQTPPGICCRLQRQWLTQITNFSNTNMTFEFDFESITPGTLPLNRFYIRLLVDDDGNFSNATVIDPSISVSGGVLRVTVSAANFVGKPYFTIASTQDLSVLPVSFTSFTGICNNSNTQLKWSVGSVPDNNFVVERSNDRVNFTAAAVVTPNASGSQNYQWTDLSPLPGVTYYRIKATDANQAVYYSAIIAVSSCGNNKMMLTTDPVSGESALNIQLQQNTTALISLYDVAGRKFDIPGLTGKQSLQRGTYRMPVSLQSLTAGIYLLSVEMNGNKYVYRVVKQ
ncbi:MAG: BNR-repeat neuraminidase N-terminal domain-containing protein [Chitinophagaceae bacterium]